MPLTLDDAALVVAACYDARLSVGEVHERLTVWGVIRCDDPADVRDALWRLLKRELVRLTPMRLLEATPKGLKAVRLDCLPPPVRFHYRNHRGEVAWRQVRPIAWQFMATQHHQPAQWILQALDVEKREDRQFALANVLEWER